MRSLFFLHLTLLMFLTPSVLAAGGGGGGGFGGSSGTSTPRKSPQQLAVEGYQRGLKYRDRAWEYEKEAAAESDPKKRDKLLAKAQKQFRNAQKRYKKTIAVLPGAYEAHSSLGYAYRKTGDYELSLASYNQALTLKPNYTEAIEYRGETYLELTRLEDAKQAYMTLFRSDREKADMLMVAMQEWLEKSEDNSQVSNQVKDAFANWVAERAQLNQQTLDLSPERPDPWSPAS